MKRTLVLSILAAVAVQAQAEQQPLTYGVRPFYLIDNLEDGALKQELLACTQQSPKKTEFAIGHRGGDCTGGGGFRRGCGGEGQLRRAAGGAQGFGVRPPASPGGGRWAAAV